MPRPMSIGWDPKISRVDSTSQSAGAEPVKAEQNPPKSPESFDAPPLQGKPIKTPEHAKISPEKSDRGPKSDALEKEMGALKTALRGPKNDRLSAAQTAIALAFSYKLRRNRSARRQGLQLLEDVGSALPEMNDAIQQLRSLLEAEGLLQENSENATLEACQRIIELLTQLELDSAGETF